MAKESEDKKDKKTVEEKIDFLIAESEKATLERKRERVLSKVDGLYNVLIALSTFLIGLVISQHGFFVNTYTFGLFLSITGIIVTMIISYVVGFIGMVKDSIENRILSWSLFLTSIFTMGISSLMPFFVGNDVLSVLGRLAIGAAFIFTLYGLSSMIVTWFEKKFSEIIGQETHEWKITKKKVTRRVTIFSYAIFVMTILISVIIVILFRLF